MQRDLDDCIADGSGTPTWAVAPWKIPARLSPGQHTGRDAETAPATTMREQGQQ